MKRKERKSILGAILVVIALSTSLLGACSQQQGNSSVSVAPAASGSIAPDTDVKAADAASGGEAAQREASHSQAASAVAASSGAGALDLSKTFPSWNADSASLAKLVAYVREVTDKDGSNYVEPADRVATFDMDGTLMCEKAPVYVDYCLLFHRVFDDPSYKAPAEYVQICNQLRANADKGIVDDALGDSKNEALVGSFAGMAPGDFIDYVNEFIDTASAEGFDGMTYGESIYKPMAEVVDYLHANDFEVYIVTACERAVARAIGGSKLGIEPDHVIGTDYGTKATGQGDTPAGEYTFTPEDELVFDGTKDVEVGKMNKVISIEHEIGKRPILAFGNSSGDYAMLNYAQANPDHEGMGLLVLCDDAKREYGDLDRAAKQAGEAAEAGWTTVSMADDWATVYGDGVEKTQLAADDGLAQAA